MGVEGQKWILRPKSRNYEEVRVFSDGTDNR